MYRLSKNQRLLNKQAFDAVFKHAYRVSNRHFILLYRKNTLGYSRMGMAISKKAIPKAYLRNKVKRVLRESFRLNTPVPSVDMVVLANKSILRDVAHLKTSADSLWGMLSAQYER